MAELRKVIADIVSEFRPNIGIPSPYELADRILAEVKKAQGQRLNDIAKDADQLQATHPKTSKEGK